MLNRVIHPLPPLEGHRIRRQGDRLIITPALGPQELEAVRALKPALLALLKDGEEVSGEALLADPRRRAALLRALGREEAPTPQPRRMVNTAPPRQEAAPPPPGRPDPWRLPPGLELGALSPLRGREAEIAARAKGWEFVERIRALDRATGEAFSIRLNRCGTHELPALLAELEEVLARLEGERGGAHGR